MSEYEKTILLVEDEPMIAFSESKILKNSGYKVITASNGENAIDIVSHNNLIDLILMDIDLGVGIDGTEVAHEILKKHDIPVVFLSSRTEPEIIKKVDEISSYGYILKGSDDTVLITSIKMAFRLHETNLELQRSKENYKKIFDEDSDGFCLVDPETEIIIDCNKALAKLVGREKSEIVGINQKILYPPKDNNKMFSINLEQDTIDNEVYFSEIKIITKTGEIKNVELKIYLTEFDHKKVLNKKFRIISKHKQIEDSLHESEERFRVLFEQAAVGVALIHTPTGTFVRINQKYSDILGYSTEEMEKMNFMSITYPDDLQEDLNNMELLKSGKISEFSMEKRLFRKDNSIVWVNLTVSPIRQMGKPPDFHIAVIKDITLRKLGEEKLYYQANLLNNVSDAIISTNNEFIIQSWNKAAEFIYGWNEEEVIGKDVHKILQTIYTNDISQKVLEQYLNTGNWQGEVIQTGKDKKNILIYSSVSRLKDIYGNTIGAVAINRDITRYKEAENALKESEEKYRNLYKNTPVMLHSIDSDRRLVSVSNYWLKVMGYDEKEVIGSKITDFLTDESRKYAEEVNLPFFFKTGYITEIPYQFVKKNGEIIDILFSAISEKDDLGNLIRSLAVSIDITERKKSEEEIKKLNEDLKNRANELESVNRELESFSWSVSHDLRNQLNIIKGFSNFLATEYSDRLDSQGKDYIKTIRITVSNMTKLTNEILKLSRITKVEINCVDVNLSLLVKSMTKDLKNSQPERKVRIIIAPGIKARADEGLITMVLNNLIGNAWKYTGKKDNAIIEFGSLQDGDKIIYFVRDNGSGFDMKHVDKIFIPFKRLHNEGEFEGTGIGLATVQRIINRHGGKVWAEGKTGEGATFFFTL